MKQLAAVLVLILCPAPLLADTPEQILDCYAERAKQENPAFAGFSIEHGHELYLTKRVLPVVGAINKPNCEMVIGRECTTQEKGDLIAWLIPVK